jgi:predicted Zn-dependent protease
MAPPKVNWTAEGLYLIAERGRLLFLQGRLQEATIVFDGLLALDPDNWYYSQALAAIYIKYGQPDAALRLMDDLLSRDPSDLESRIRRCEALTEMGETEKARSEWREMWRCRRDCRLTRLALRLGIPMLETDERLRA